MELILKEAWMLNDGKWNNIIGKLSTITCFVNFANNICSWNENNADISFFYMNWKSTLLKSVHS